MIIDEKPLTFAEIIKLVGTEEKAEEMKKFIGQFNKDKYEEAMKMKEELAALELLKLNEKSVINLVNFKPKDASDLNKVLVDISLSQEEVEKILNVTKNY
jgi:DNA-directed RNA polymerase subunit F